MVTEKKISSAQSRAARALLGWTQAELSERSTVSSKSINDFETGKRVPMNRTLRDLRAALEAAGVVFLEAETDGLGCGVRFQADPNT